MASAVETVCNGDQSPVSKGSNGTEVTCRTAALTDPSLDDATGNRASENSGLSKQIRKLESSSSKGGSGHSQSIHSEKDQFPTCDPSDKPPVSQVFTNVGGESQGSLDIEFAEDLGTDVDNNRRSDSPARPRYGSKPPSEDGSVMNKVASLQGRGMVDRQPSFRPRSASISSGDSIPRMPTSPYRDALEPLAGSKHGPRMPRMPISPFPAGSRRSLSGTSEGSADRSPRMPTSPYLNTSRRSLGCHSSSHSADISPRMPFAAYNSCSRRSLGDCGLTSALDKSPRKPSSPYSGTRMPKYAFTSAFRLSMPAIPTQDNNLTTDRTATSSSRGPTGRNTPPVSRVDARLEKSRSLKGMCDEEIPEEVCLSTPRKPTRAQKGAKKKRVKVRANGLTVKQHKMMSEAVKNHTEKNGAPRDAIGMSVKRWKAENSMNNSMRSLGEDRWNSGSRRNLMMSQSSQRDLSVSASSLRFGDSLDASQRSERMSLRFGDSLDVSEHSERVKKAWQTSTGKNWVAEDGTSSTAQSSHTRSRPTVARTRSKSEPRLDSTGSSKRSEDDRAADKQRKRATSASSRRIVGENPCTPPPPSTSKRGTIKKNQFSPIRAIKQMSPIRGMRNLFHIAAPGQSKNKTGNGVDPSMLQSPGTVNSNGEFQCLSKLKIKPDLETEPVVPPAEILARSPTRGVEPCVSDVSDDALFQKIRAAGVSEAVLQSLTNAGLVISEKTEDW